MSRRPAVRQFAAAVCAMVIAANLHATAAVAQPARLTTDRAQDPR
jgi:hypothetical protein